MKLGQIALKIRAAETRFKDYVAGAAEFGYAWKNILKTEMAFVVPLTETASANDQDVGINQKVTERFAVVIVLRNDTSSKDRTGLTAYDLIHDVRAEIFSAILGWQLEDAESVISYAGARLLNVNEANLWYQFEFVSSYRLDDDDCVDDGIESLDNFNTIYTQYELAPSENLPVSGVPVSAFSPDMTQAIDLTEDPRYGAFSAGFGPTFDTYDEDRRY